MHLPLPPSAQNFNPLITIYNGVSPKPKENITLALALNSIEDGTYKEIVEKIRTIDDKKARGKEKIKLPAVTFSGVYSYRNEESIIEYSGLVHHDIDGLTPDEAKELQRQLESDKYVFASFKSPSGKGVKILFRTDRNIEKYLEVWSAIGSYLVNTYSIVFDVKCKDSCRLCFLSHDPAMNRNEDAEIIGSEFLKQWKIADKPKEYTSSDYLDKCHEITAKTKQAAPGMYNDYICTFSLFANRYGVSELECCTHLQNFCSEHDTKETAISVRAVYKNFSAEHGQWLKNATFLPATTSKQKKINKHSAIVIDTKQLDSTDVFWYSVDVKGKPEYRFSYRAARNFLKANGFFKYKTGKDTYQFIYINDAARTVSVTNALQIKEFMVNFLEVYDFDEDDNQFAIQEMFLRSVSRYCNVSFLDTLEYADPTFKKDSKYQAFIYFKNCFVEVTKDGQQIHDYSEMKGYIWDKQVMPLDYKTTDGVGDFEQFVIHAISGREATEKAPYLEEEKQKIFSVCSTIGYMLHRYKNPAITKAVISVDKMLRQTGEQNGRSGKSLFGKGIREMLNVCLIDGRNFKFDAPFPFQTANIDTELIDFNDVPKNFDFSRLFGMITEEFTFDKKGKDSIVMSFTDAPKFYISTNYTLRGDGESMKGRQQIIEFSNYYNTELTPLSEFGKMFFYDWDDNEYLLFYKFMIECILVYLQDGLIPFPLAHYEENKLIDTAGIEFVEYMKETILDQMQFVGPDGKEMDNHKLFTEFISQVPHRGKTTLQSFNKNVKAWADLNNLDINAINGGQRIKRNNITLLIFTEKK